MNNTFIYSSTDAASTSLSSYKGMFIECFGQRLEPDISLLQQFMTLRRIPFHDQKRLWLDFAQQLPHPAWAAACLQQAEQVDHLLQRFHSLDPTVHSSSAESERKYPSSPYATHHFEWRGSVHGVATEALREGILQLSAMGLIGSDGSQHDALRRGLGCTTNSVERTTPIPWVRWLGAADMLTYLVTSLFQADLVSCAGGPNEKWHTLCGLFVQPDGSLFRDTIRTSRLRHPAKRSLLDRRFLLPMTRLVQ